MRLQDYITEAISSGKYKRNKYPEELTPESIVEWLEGMGVKGYRWGDSDIGEYAEHPPVNPGEIVYYVGMCKKSQPGTSWVALYNNVGGSRMDVTQEAIIWTEDTWTKQSGRLTTYTGRGQEYDLNLIEVLDIMIQMIDNPTKIVKP